MARSTNPPPDTDVYRALRVLTLLSSMILLGTCVGWFAGVTYHRATIRPSPEWRNLGAPPQPIAALVGIDFDTVYVRTIAGEYYACYWASPYDQQCWVAMAALPNLPTDRCWFTQAPPPDPPLGPVRAVKQFHYCSSFAGSTEYSVFNYYLLESGDVLQWGRNEFHFFHPPRANLLRLRTMAVSIAIGAISGGLGAIGLLVVRRRRAARSTKDRP